MIDKIFLLILFIVGIFALVILIWDNFFRPWEEDIAIRKKALEVRQRTLTETDLEYFKQSLLFHIKEQEENQYEPDTIITSIKAKLL